MFRYVQIIFYIIVFCNKYCSTVECDNRGTMTKVIEIQSYILHEYLSLWECQNDHGDATWQYYMSKCLQNTTCVGIRTSTPPAICTLSSMPSDEPMLIGDLWLVISELETYEHQSMFLFYFMIR